MRHDPQLKAVLSAYCLPLLRATWAVDPAGCRDEVVQHVADGLGIGILGHDKKPGPARRRGVIWLRHLRLALEHLTFGHMPFELRYREEGGRLQLDNLGERMPWTIARINLADDGTISEVYQQTQQEPIPGDRLIWYVNEQEGSNWAGFSIMRPAYAAWLLKHETWRVHATSIRRFGMGVPYVEAPPGGTAAQVAQAQQLASAIRAGDQSGAGIPQGFKPMLMGLTGTVPDALAFIRYLDTSMAKMALAGLIELGETFHGSRALGETFLDLFMLALQGTADEVAQTATSGQPGMPGIVTDLVDQNWGPDEPAPNIRCLDVGEDYRVTAEALAALVTCKALEPDPTLDEWIRKQWRLPERDTPWTPPGPQTQGGPGGGPPPALPGPPASDITNPESALPVAAAALPLRRHLTPAEVASRFDAAAHQGAWQTILSWLIGAWRAIAQAQRVQVVDQVIAAVEQGRPDKLAAIDVDVSQAVPVLTQAMQDMARGAASEAVAEAGRQGVRVPPDEVRLDVTALGRLAGVWANVAARRTAQAAAAKAAVTASPGGEPHGAAVVAGDEVDAYLRGLSDRGLTDDLGGALSAAQNAGRMAGLEAVAAHATGAAPEFIATEVLDHNTCEPCLRIDGHTWGSLGDAEAAYPAGGYLKCEGMMRCRGTVIVLWHGQAEGEAA